VRLEEQIYNDIRDHQLDYDKIVAVVMNQRLLYSLIAELNFAVHQQIPTGLSVFGYQLVLMDEVPDGEWLVVVDEKVPWVSLRDWYKQQVESR
jgi:hypothetical protein